MRALLPFLLVGCATAASQPRTRGENAGETLGTECVVRRLERVAAAGHDGTIEITLDPGWNASGAVALAQRTDRRIGGARWLPR